MINLFDMFSHPSLYVAAAVLCYGAISIQNIAPKASHACLEV